MIKPLLPEQNCNVEDPGDVNAELSALEKRRDKTCALKQGIIQELPADRTRLDERGNAVSP